MSDINVNEVVNLLDTQMPVSEIVLSCQKDLVYRFVKANDRQPTIEEMRQMDMMEPHVQRIEDALEGRSEAIFQ